MKKQMFTGLKLCAQALLLFLAWHSVFAQAQNSEITVTVSRDLVRFAAPGDVQETRIEVFSPTGEKLFDSDFVTGQTQDWQLKDPQGQAVESGLYAYTVTIKDKDGNLRTQRGNVIVGRVTMEREIELTSGGIKFPDNTIQTTAANGGAATTGGKDGADGNDGVTETKPESGSINKQAAAAKVEGSGTAGKIARWTDAGTIGDSVISQANGAVTIASPTTIESDQPDNSEDSASLTLRITRPTATRAGVAFQDQQLKPIGSLQLNRALAGGTGLAIRHQRTDGRMSQALTITPAGAVGVNTTNPKSQLEVSAEPGSINKGVVTVSGDVDGSDASAGQIVVQPLSSAFETAGIVMQDSQRAPMGAIQTRRDSASRGTALAIKTVRNDGQMRQPLTVTPLGFFGVNTTNPKSYLEVSADPGSINKGIITVSGDIDGSDESTGQIAVQTGSSGGQMARMVMLDSLGAAMGSMQLNRALAGGTGLAIKHKRPDGRMSQTLTITPAGAVGVNTTNPKSQLEVSAEPGSINKGVITVSGDVDGSDASAGQIVIQPLSSAFETAGIVMQDSRRAPLGAIQTRREPAGATTSIMSKRADGLMRQALTVTPLGFCGVNTPNPTSLLEARADAGSITNGIITANGDISEVNDAAGHFVAKAGALASQTARITMLDSQSAAMGSFQMSKAPGGGTVMAVKARRADGQIRQPLTVDQRGYLGIDKATPVEKVDVNGTGVTRVRVNSDWNAGMRLAIKDQDQWSVATVEVPFGGTLGGVSRDFQIYSELAGRNALYIREGSLSISTGGGLSTNGNVSPTNDNAYFLGAQFQRWRAVFATNGTIQTSDARLKQGVENLGYGLREVMRLRPVTFKWKESDDARTHLGLIAQEVKPIIPEAIERGATPDVALGMNYTSFVPVLIKAVQEQQAEIARRDAQINLLRQQLADLAARLKAVEQTLPQTARR